MDSQQYTSVNRGDATIFASAQFKKRILIEYILSGIRYYLFEYKLIKFVIYNGPILARDTCRWLVDKSIIKVQLLLAKRYAIVIAQFMNFLEDIVIILAHTKKARTKKTHDYLNRP